MKIGQLASTLGVDKVTIYNWVARPEFESFFSAECRGQSDQSQRVFSEDDICILNTIRALRMAGYKDWSLIRRYLDDGYRVNDLPYTHLETSGLATQDIMALENERDSALERLNELSHRLTVLETENRELMHEIIRLNREIGRLEGQLSVRSEET